MSFIIVVGFKQITWNAALGEMSLLTLCRKTMLGYRHEVNIRQSDNS